jgi:hypothetical protein
MPRWTKSLNTQIYNIRPAKSRDLYSQFFMFSHDLTIKSLLKPQVIPNTHGKKKYAIIL